MITLKITVTAVIIGIVWGTILAVMRLSSFAPIARFANLRERIPLYSAGHGAAVVLSDCTGVLTERIRPITENRYSSDLSDGGIFDV